MRNLVLIFICVAPISCSFISPSEISKVISLADYNDLSWQEKYLVNKITRKIIKSDRQEYYYSKLQLLLSIETNIKSTTAQNNRKRINKSVRKNKAVIKSHGDNINEHIYKEEMHELRDLKWYGYRPNWNGKYFYVSHDYNTDILVHIRVRLNGERELIEKILYLEDAIEKQLEIPGFSVNLIFMAQSDGDVFEVEVNPEKWITSHNWAGGHKALAHELMHLMGLTDEYDRIKNHATNKNMERMERLRHFWAQMDNEVPADSKYGIMCYYNYKPLHRHVCAAVGLGEECVAERLEFFGREY